MFHIFQKALTFDIHTSVIELITLPGQNLTLKKLTFSLFFPTPFILRKLTEENYTYNAFCYWIIDHFYENNSVKGLRSHVGKINSWLKLLFFVC